MRFLGIDFGTKRIGLALSDENGTLAFPKETILNNADTLDKLTEIIQTENVEEVVMGESVDSSGAQNTLSAKIEALTAALSEKSGVKIHKEKEFFSSYEAHGRMGKEMHNARAEKFDKTEGVDAKAAAIILQRFLDKKNKQAPRFNGQ